VGYDAMWTGSEGLAASIFRRVQEQLQIKIYGRKLGHQHHYYLFMKI
jgi:hypothetical protein